MKRYHNIKETKKVGARIRELRIMHNFSKEDIAAMTGFSRSTITKVENGADTDTSHLIEIAKAIGEHPKEIFNVSFDIKPRYKLSPNRQNRALETARINKLYAESNFFETPKFVTDVINTLTELYKIKAKSIYVSVVLKRFVDDGKLQYKKVGRRNFYVNKIS